MYYRIVRPQRTVPSAPGVHDWRNVHMAPSRHKAVESRPTVLWSFVMVAASVETISAFLHEIKAGPRAFSTLAVWNALFAYVSRDTGVIRCSQRTLARTAGVSVGDVQRAFLRLVEMGVLLKEERGRYRIHPSVLWRGELAKRGLAEDATPRLTLVEGGKAD